MRKLVCIAVFALAPFGLAAADDIRGEQGCTPSGAWVGTLGGVPVMTITYGRESAQSGTVVIDYPAFDPTLGMYSDVVKGSAVARGVWTKTGGNTWFYAALILAVKADGSTAYVYKISGPVTGTEGCTSLTIETVLSVYAPGVNPFTGDPLWSMALGDHGGYPMAAVPPPQ